jgi:hypothetical protein
MAYITGTATDYDDLLDTLKSFLTTNASLVALGQEWVCEKDEEISSYSISGIASQPPSYSDDFRDLYFHGPGLSQQDDIYVNIRRYSYVPSNIYNLYIAGATGYSSGDAWEDQPGISFYSSKGPCIYTLVNSTIEYWMMATGRWFQVIAKIGGDYYHTFNGLINPYGKPSEAPYFMLVSGTADYPTYNYTHGSLENFWNVRNTNQRKGLFRMPSTQWASISSTDYYGGATPYCSISPWWRETVGQEYYNLVGNLDGSYSTLPATLFTGEDNSAILGEIPNIAYVPGAGLSSEDTLSIDGTDWLVIQNVGLTDRTNFCAIKME